MEDCTVSAMAAVSRAERRGVILGFWRGVRFGGRTCNGGADTCV